ncbi:MAG: hypothetical protein B7Y42_00345 [Polaromonas sp. 28-63-22]|jgi:hypothetical protein|nr:MAG: hypothetical protein B7Y42_00345 [Polaromonas sp. 28-63-22]
MIEQLQTTLQTPFIWVEIFATTCGLFGSFVLACKGRHAQWGWVLFALSNIGWLAFGYGYGHWFFFIQQIGYSITSAIGIWKWLIEPAINRRYERVVREVLGL